MIRDLPHKTLEWAARSDQPQQWDHCLLSLKLKDNVLASQFFGHKVEELWYNQADTKSAGSSGMQNTSLSQRRDNLPPNNLVVGNERIDALIDYSKTYGGDVFDLGASAYQYFLLIPPSVVWMLLRARHLERNDRKPAAEHLKTLLDLACKSTSWVI